MRLIIKTGCCAVFLFLFAFAPSAAGAEEWKLTLNQSIERALSENRDVEVVRQRLVELEGLKGEVRSQAFPQLTGNANYTHTWRKPQIDINGASFSLGSRNDYLASANVSQLLWDGGRVLKALRAARLEEARGIQNIRDAEALVRLRVKQTFYEILYTDKVISVLESQLKQLRLHLSAIQTRFNQGLDSDYTLMRQEVAVSNVEPNLIEAKRNRELLLNSLKILLVIPAEDKFTPEGTFDYHSKNIPPIEELVERAKRERPDLAAEKLREQSLREGIGLEKSGYFPTLNMTADIQWEGQTDRWSLSPDRKADSLKGAVNFKWPIFDGLKTHSRIKQARAKFMQQHFMVSQLEDSVVRDVKDTYDTLVRARQTLMSQQKSLALARKSTEIAGKRFESGLMSQLELNDTITSQTTAEQNYLRAAIDCLTAEAAMEKVTGGAL